MTPEKFAKVFFMEKQQLVSDFCSSPQVTLVSKLIDEMKLNEVQSAQIEEVIDAVLTDAFYTILLGLDGSASIGGIQQEYKIYDEAGKRIGECGDITAAAFEYFHEKPQASHSP